MKIYLYILCLSNFAYIYGSPVQVYEGGTGLISQTTGNLLITNGSNPFTLLAPHNTIGIPLVSQGSLSNPNYAIAVVQGGGTGVSTMTTAYAPICSGTTPTGSLQVASAGLSNAGYVLTSNGTSALPSFQPISDSSGIQTITGDVGGTLSGSNINVSGGLTGLLFIGSGATESLSGTLTVANGGTGATSLTSNGLLIGAGTSAITPLAVGGTNTVLLGNTGASPSFGQVQNAALANSSVTLSNGNNISVTGSPLSLGGTASIALSGTTNHGVQVGNASGSLTSLGVGTNGQILVGSTGADPAFVTPTAGTGLSLTSNATTLQYALLTPVSVANGGTGVGTLTNHGVLLGQATSTIAATAVGATNTVLLGNTGADPSFGQVPNAALANSSVTLSNGNNITVTGSPLSLGGTATVALSGTTNHGVQVGNASGSLTSLGVGTNGQILVGSTAADPSFVTPTAGTGLSLTSNATTLQYALSTPVSVANGGTGVGTLTNHGVLLGQATSTIAATAVGATNTVLLGNTGADPSFGQVPNAALANSSVTLSNGNNISVTGSPLSLGGTASIALSGTTNHGVQVGNASGSLTSLAVGTDGQVLVGSTGADPAFVTPTAGTGLSVTANATTHQYALSTPVSVANGGSGLAATTAYAVLCGGTTNTAALQSVASVGTAGQVLTSNGAGALPTFQTVVQTTTVTLTSAQVKALRATPITIVAAPGVNKVVNILSCFVKLKYGGTSAFTAGASQTLRLGYIGTGGTAILTTALANTSIVATTDRVAFSGATANTGFADTGATLATNSAVVIYNSVATEISGNAANDNTIVVSVTYQIVSV